MFPHFLETWSFYHYSGPNQSFDSSAPLNLWPYPCIECNTELQAQDPITGLYYLYCSNECAAPKTLRDLPTVPILTGGFKRVARVNANTNTRAIPAFAKCNHCNKKPRYNDGVLMHSYCDGTCANAAMARDRGDAAVRAPALISLVEATNRVVTKNPSQVATSGNIVGLPSITSPINTRNRLGPVDIRNRNIVLPNPASTRNDRSPVHLAASPQVCQTPGCVSLLPASLNGVAGKYCNESHKQLGKNGCISCRKRPMSGSLPFCQSCYYKVPRGAPMIVELPEDHERYRSVESQFRQKWLHNGECPEVRAIYKIVSTKANSVKYKQYLDGVEARGNFGSRGESRGNERRRWHGTTRVCKIGDKGVTQFCLDPSCSLCCIMKSSFDLSFFLKTTNFGRFGAGIYTSSTSSKSNSYSSNSCNSDWKAILLNNVVVGRGYKLTADNRSLTEPPAGYDSVLGEVGVSLNYDELVVYNNDAIRPSYLVMYDTPGRRPRASTPDIAL